jgi:hypothetical protein
LHVNDAKSAAEADVMARALIAAKIARPRESPAGVNLFMHVSSVPSLVLVRL